MYLPGHPPLPRHGAVRVPPDVAIEIVTPTPRDVRRDRVEKVDDYAAFGVRQYWIVDPEQQTFELFELGADGRYVRALGATGGTLTAVPGCEGFTLDLDELWREAEKLGPDQSQSAPRLAVLDAARGAPAFNSPSRSRFFPRRNARRSC